MEISKNADFLQVLKGPLNLLLLERKIEMEHKSLKQFHKELSWSTRIYTLLTVALLVGAYVFDANQTSWALPIAGAIAVVLFVESFAISFHRHPKTWRVIKWAVILILLTLLLIGAGIVYSGSFA